MLSRRESELQADAVTVVCPYCLDEYIAFVSWSAFDVIVERQDKCSCRVSPVVERASVADHYAEPPESVWSEQYRAGSGGVL